MTDTSDAALRSYFQAGDIREREIIKPAITTKLPYVAGYSPQDSLRDPGSENLDEIYGETARHSLMGNCGYQLAFGANDQVTAEAVSKGLASARSDTKLSPA